MSVIAKFRVNEVVNRASYTNKEVNMVAKLSAVMPDNSEPTEENVSFWTATPSASMEICIQNPAAAEQFQPGDEFYVTFEKA